MSPVEAGELLVLMATFDQRTVEDGDAETWAQALGNMTLATARSAVLAHYGSTRHRVMPADIWNLVRSGEPERLGEQHGACPFKGCTCTHTEPCDRGWIENGGGDSVRPCPSCRSDQAQIVQDSSPEPAAGRLAGLRERGRFAGR